MNLIPVVLNQSSPLWSLVSMNWGGGVGGWGGGTQRVWSSTSHTFLLWFLQLPHLFPSLGALLIPNVLKFLQFSPGSHYPNSGFFLCHLTVNLHFPHSQITTTPMSLPPPPPTNLPQEFFFGKLDLLSSCRKRSTGTFTISHKYGSGLIVIDAHFRTHFTIICILQLLTCEENSFVISCHSQCVVGWW